MNKFQEKIDEYVELAKNNAKGEELMIIEKELSDFVKKNPNEEKFYSSLEKETIFRIIEYITFDEETNDEIVNILSIIIQNIEKQYSDTSLTILQHLQLNRYQLSLSEYIKILSSFQHNSFLQEMTQNYYEMNSYLEYDCDYELETQKKEFETEKGLLLNKIENSIPIPTSWFSRFIFVFNYKYFDYYFLSSSLQEYGVKNGDIYVIKNDEGLDLVFIKLREDISIDNFIAENNFTRFDHIPIHLIPFIPSYFDIIKSGKNCVLVEGLKKDYEVCQIFETFRNYGEIIDCHIPLDSNNQSLGYCFIHFLNHSDGEK